MWAWFYIVMSAAPRCLAQLATYAQGKKALLADPSVCEALGELANTGVAFGEAARDFAAAALMALSDKELHLSREGQMHIMLSCACINTMLTLHFLSSSSSSAN